MKKRIIATLIAASMAALTLVGCSSESNKKITDTAQSDTQSEVSSDEAADSNVDIDGNYVIGISQFAEHSSLDNCREGFLQGLAEEGIIEGENLTVEYQNAQTDTGSAATISDEFVAKNVNLICAIATPAAMSAYNSCLETDIPVIYSAISDPVGAGLANEDKTSVGNITGTSDALAVDAQLEMIREVLPDAKKIGIIYTTSEANSVSTIEQYKEAADKYGFEIVDKGISAIGDVDMAAASLVGEVDCINNLTDNTVVSALQTVLSNANEAGIPVFGSEVEQVKAGCVAAMGIDYTQLGIQTGKMAAKVLKGEATCAELEYEVIEDPSLYINTAALDGINIEINDELLEAASETYDEITVE